MSHFDTNGTVQPAEAVPFGRRLADLVSEIDFLQVQLQTIQATAKAHRTRNLGSRIGAIHDRLDLLEGELRLRAAKLGFSDDESFGQLNHQLRKLNHDLELAHEGPERRNNRPARTRRRTRRTRSEAP